MGQKRDIKSPPPSSSFKLRCPSLNSLRLRRIFDMFDKNGDAMITVKEISQAMNMLGLEAEVTEIENMTRSYIRPGNEGLTYEDFEALHESLGESYFGIVGMDNGGDDDADADDDDEKKQQEESDMWEAFKVFDEDGDGFISAKELQVVLGKLGLAEGNEIERVQKMIVSVDRNRDGLVDFSEFKDMMRTTIAVPS